jgi:riboflavin kinase/FMN adenylyltransferase
VNIYQSPPDRTTPEVLVIGTFDGLHRGHRYLISRARESTEQAGCPLGVMTFNPDPEFVLSGADPTERRILRRGDKMAILSDMDVDHVYEIPFDEEFSRVTAEEFIEEYLVETLDLNKLCVGDNFRFGRDRNGSAEMLRNQLGRRNIDVDVVGPLEDEGQVVSSTRIREAIRDGRMEMARELLGRPYITHESVREGEGRGREIGFPTFNFAVDHTIHPAMGVYSVWLGNRELEPAVANFGRRPTVSGDDSPVLEVHCLDQPPSLSVGDRSHVYFVEHLREEVDFDGIDALQQQIEEDVRAARNSLESQPRPTTIGNEPAGV